MGRHTTAQAAAGQNGRMWARCRKVRTFEPLVAATGFEPACARYASMGSIAERGTNT